LPGSTITKLTSYREIIDESDVYIDVHKAIRRLAPAPKAQRITKGLVVDPDAPVAEEHLIDLGEAADTQHTDGDHKDANHKPVQMRLGSIGERGSTAVPLSTSPKTTFLMRRSSSAADGTSNVPVSVRSNAVDMREHLKHLGPSNLASRPKTTRYQTVKIKPGTLGAAPDALRRTQTSSEVPYKDFPAPRGGEGEGLLNSAGKDASDGVQALQQGYGSVGRSSPTKNTDENRKPVQVDGPNEVPTARRVNSDTSESDTIGSLPSSRGSPVPRKSSSFLTLDQKDGTEASEPF